MHQTDQVEQSKTLLAVDSVDFVKRRDLGSSESLIKPPDELKLCALKDPNLRSESLSECVGLSTNVERH